MKRCSRWGGPVKRWPLLPRWRRWWGPFLTSQRGSQIISLNSDPERNLKTILLVLFTPVSILPGWGTRPRGKLSPEFFFFFLIRRIRNQDMCEYLCMCGYMGVCRNLCTCVHTQAEVGRQPQGLFFRCCSSCLWVSVFIVLDLTKQTRPQESVCLHLPISVIKTGFISMCHHTKLGLHRLWVPNSGPCTCKTSTL